MASNSAARPGLELLEDRITPDGTTVAVPDDFAIRKSDIDPEQTQLFVLDVLKNDIFVDPFPLNLSIDEFPESGTASVRRDNTIIFVPFDTTLFLNKGFDVFSYELSSGDETSTGTIFIDLIDGNFPPEGITLVRPLGTEDEEPEEAAPEDVPDEPGLGSEEVVAPGDDNQDSGLADEPGNQSISTLQETPTAPISNVVNSLNDSGQNAEAVAQPVVEEVVDPFVFFGGFSIGNERFIDGLGFAFYSAIPNSSTSPGAPPVKTVPSSSDGTGAPDNGDETPDDPSKVTDQGSGSSQDAKPSPVNKQPQKKPPLKAGGPPKVEISVAQLLDDPETLILADPTLTSFNSPDGRKFPVIKLVIFPQVEVTRGRKEEPPDPDKGDDSSSESGQNNPEKGSVSIPPTGKHGLDESPDGETQVNGSSNQGDPPSPGKQGVDETPTEDDAVINGSQ